MPSGKGQIVNWDRSYCYKCERKFKSNTSLYMHLIASKNHVKKLIEKEKEKEKQKQSKYITLDKFILS